MDRQSRVRGAAQVVECLLALRRNLANSEFLQQQFYTRDESRFVDSTYVYWIRLHFDRVADYGIDMPSDPITDELQRDLNRQIDRKIIERIPGVYSSLVKLSSSTKPEYSVQACLAEREKRLQQELPTCIPFGIFYGVIARLIKSFDAEKETSPNAEEFVALLDHLSRHALKQGRCRFPELWDEVKGHYVLDSRGAIFGKAFANGLKNRGYLLPGDRFVDLGSGVGTMVAAVARFTDAHATGIEKHSGVIRLAKAMIRRLSRKRCFCVNRMEFILGDFLQSQVLDLDHYDVLYVYSPIGKSEIEMDDVIDRMRMGSILAMSAKPQRNSRLVEDLEPVAGLSCFRKINKG